MANTQGSARDSTDAKAKLVAPRGGDGVAKPEETFSRLVTLRRTIFPIYGRQEVVKFLLIGSIKFFIILALTLTRDTKDTLVVTQCGAEAIAFLKVRLLDPSVVVASLQLYIIHVTNEHFVRPCLHASEACD
jgi:ATP/ADP translocase